MLVGQNITGCCDAASFLIFLPHTIWNTHSEQHLWGVFLSALALQKGNNTAVAARGAGGATERT